MALTLVMQAAIVTGEILSPSIRILLHSVLIDIE